MAPLPEGSDTVVSIKGEKSTMLNAQKIVLIFPSSSSRRYAVSPLSPPSTS